MFRLRFPFLILLFLTLLSPLIFAQTDASDVLPQQSGEVALSVVGLDDASAQRGIDSRLLLPDGMTVLPHPATGSVHRAFGPPLRIPGYDRITDDNVRDAAAAFLRTYRPAIGVDPEQLQLQRVTKVRGRWYITWRQQHAGMDILLSEVELRLFANGNVAMYGAAVYPDINVTGETSLGVSDAWSAAVEGLDVEPALRKVAARRTAVLPIGQGSNLRYHVVYEIPVRERNGKTWTSYVDAGSGDLLWRRATSFDAGTEVHAHGGVTLVHPHEAALTDQSFADMYVTVAGSRYTTSADGRIDADLQTESAVTATFEGPWCKVVLSDHENGGYSGTVQPGGTLDLLWDDSNSHKFERILFYHTNYNRTYLRSIDPDFDAMDFQTKVSVEFGGQMPNAMSNGNEVRFLAAGHESMRMAASPMVLYHELGHSVNIKMYEQLGASDGMENRSCQEGTADLHAAMITDYPAMGTGVFADDEDRVMRHLENDMIYPDSLSGEGHHDGQILSGAFWDLRKSTSLAVARDLSHFAKYGLPDDPDDGVAFAEWFIETLIADDDDGDLSNGTPHYREIVAAFTRHHIGPDLFLVSNFRHIPVADTEDTLHPYPVRFLLKTANLPESGVEDVHVMYRLNGSGTDHRVDAIPTGTGEMEALIPAQHAGTMVSYWIVATESLSGREVRFSADTRGGTPWRFLVGYHGFFVDPFEEDLGWTVGDSDDGATKGAWERGVPQSVDMRQYGGPFLQPGEDHTETGSHCYVTGARGGFDFLQYLPDGRTTLTSPRFDLREATAPLIRLYYFFTLMVNPQASLPPTVFRVQLSDDNGQTWTTAFETEQPAPDWTQLTLPLEEIIGLSDAVRVRIVLDVPPNGAAGMPDVLTEALIDDFMILSATPRGPTPVPPTASVPRGASITGSYPSPMSQQSAATITYHLPESGFAALDVYDLLGRKVAALSRVQLPAGEHSVRWDGSTVGGTRVSAGTYILSLTTSREVVTRTLVVH